VKPAPISEQQVSEPEDTALPEWAKGRRETAVAAGYIGKPRFKVQPAYGAKTTIAIPGEETTYPARYSVREASDVYPSHNPQSFEPNPGYEYSNDRDYSQAGNAARVVENSSPGKFSPEYTVTESPTAEHGPTVIDQRGNALGGNNRLMTIQRVYARGGEDAEAYRRQLSQKASQFGINPAELARFKNPVLVRERVGKVNPQKEITDYNKTAAAALSPAEQAVADGRRLSPAALRDITGRLEDIGEESTLAQALRGEDGAEVINTLVRDGVITEQEKNGYIDERGFLTPEAKDRIAKMIVGRLFESPAEFSATPPELRNKLERIAPHVLRVESREGWRITPLVREAVTALQDARAHGIKNLDDLARQTTLGGETRNYSLEALAIAKKLQEGPLAAQRAFRQYANDEALSREGAQTSMFTPPTRQEAFDAAFRGVQQVPASPFFRPLRPSRSAVNLASLPALAQDLDSQFHEQTKVYPAHVYVNGAGMELMRRALGPETGPFAGALFTPEEATKVISELGRMARAVGEKAGAPIHQLRTQLVRARLNGGFALAITQQGMHDLRATVGEEMFHNAWVVGGGGTSLGGLTEEALLSDPAFDSVVTKLMLSGYVDSQSLGGRLHTAIAEAAAKIGQPEDWHEFGITKAEAIQAAAHVKKLLVETRGAADAEKVVRWWDRGFRRELDAVSKTGQRQVGDHRSVQGNEPGTTSGGGSVRREVGQRARPTSDESSLKRPLGDGSIFGDEADERTAREVAADRDKLQGERLT
jgi:hypothetical protein